MKEEELTKVIQESTEKLNVLTVMQEEKNYLNQALIQQKKQQKKSLEKDHLDYKRDVIRLREISKHQREQIDTLRKEIQTLSFKCKPPAQTRSYEHLEYQAPTPPQQTFHQRVFEDSVYTNIVESRADSSKASTPNMELFKEMSKIIKLFFIRSLRDKFDSNAVQSLICTLARYLTNVASTFPQHQADKLLPDIIDNFQKFIPKDILSQIPKHEIAKLIEEVIENFQDENEVELKDVLREIVVNSVMDLPMTDIDYSQKLLTEIIKQLIVILRVQDLNEEERLQQVAGEIKVKSFNACAINIKEMTGELVNYAAENYLDDIEPDWLKHVIGRIVYYLQQK